MASGRKSACRQQVAVIRKHGGEFWGVARSWCIRVLRMLMDCKQRPPMQSRDTVLLAVFNLDDSWQHNVKAFV